MIRSKKLNIITYMTLLSFAICSCGNKKNPVPELLDPVTVTESFRPVELGDIGEVTIENGVIVPEEHCYFWTSPVVVKDIAVDVGQYVNEGDVLAYADIEQATDVLSNLQNELANLNANYEQDKSIYEFKHKELEYVLQGAKESGVTDAITKAETNLAVLEENNRYDKLLYEYKVGQKNKSISKQSEVVQDGKLVAASSGYVTYIKDLTETNYATNADNIVVISDFENSYIEVPSMEQSDKYRKTHKDYTRFFTEIGGIRYDLEEIKYSPEELVVTENKSMYPYMRFKISDNSKLPEIGTNIPVFISKDVIENVLIVGNDSIYDDSKGSFVYVKDGDKKSVRYVELGKVGENYTEIISGLDEGELVYYSSGALLPEHYIEKTVEGSEYKVVKTTKSYTHKKSDVGAYYSDYEGQVTALNVSMGMQVNKGDLICTIKTNDGSAKLAEMSNNITNLKQNNERQIKQFDAQINDIELKMAELNEAGQTDANATPTDAGGQDTDPYLYQQLELQIEQIKCMKQKENANFKFQLNRMQSEYAKISCNNDGNGYVNIYAESDGMVSEIHISKNELVTVDQHMFNIMNPDSEKLVLKLNNDSLQLNQTVKFMSDDDSEVYYMGKVIGMTKSDRVYVTSDEEDIYVTKCNSYQPSTYYYVEVDKDAYERIATGFSVEFSVNTISNAVVVPVTSVIEEKVENDTYYYLWRVADGILIKQFVTILQEKEIPSQYCIVSGLKIGDILAVESE